MGHCTPSTALTHLIHRLPHILTELDDSIRQTRKSLQQLPKPPSSDPVSEVATLLHAFSGKLHTVLEGVPLSSGLLQSIRPAQKEFRCEIRRTAPDFRPFESHKRAINKAHTVYPDPPFLAAEEGYEHLWLGGFQHPSTSDVKESSGALHKPICIDEVLTRAQK